MGVLRLKKTKTNKLEIPFTLGCFEPNLVEIGPVVLERKIYKIRQCIFAI